MFPEPQPNRDIVLATLDAKYVHASLGLRYLMANMGDLRPRTVMEELVWDQPTVEIAERILRWTPRIVGLGVYVWNARETLHLVRVLKTVAPEVIVVLGGPEVSHEPRDPSLVALTDYVVAGEGDLAFAALCRELLADRRPSERIILAAPPALEDLALPYHEYTDEDLRTKVVYVEASRGCPFGCAFCLSSLDRGVRTFDLDRFLAAMDGLYARGVRRFKLVDRTFNVEPGRSRRILEHFLAWRDDELFVHVEVVPDRLPGELVDLLAAFPSGAVQLEVGIQSFDPEVQARIDRRQDLARTEETLMRLARDTSVHLHADLVVGLPGEALEQIGRGFDRLWRLGVQEIQVGLLKKLRGAPIARHDEAFRMRYDPEPPYVLLANRDLDFATMQRLARFARYWDMVGNSGRFLHALPLLLGEAPFARFLRVSDKLWSVTGQTHRIALARLFQLVFEAMISPLDVPSEVARDALAQDWVASSARGLPPCLVGHPTLANRHTATGHRTRQARHEHHAHE